MWLLVLIFLLVVYTFGPGMLLVRPLRLAPRERLVVAVGAGLFLNYVLGFVIFANHLPVLSHVVVTIVSLALGLAAWRDWQTLLRSHQVRRMLLCWGLLLVWGVLLLSMIRNFGGGTWGGDWVEHFQRSLFFLGDADYDFKFIDQYPLPMRPPMMNVLTASLLSQTAVALDFEAMMEAYQLTFVFLNSLVFLPLAILIPRLVKLPARLARKTPWTLAAILAASPMFDQNLTYTWTKLFAAFYALAGIAVYLRTWRRGTKARMKDEGGRMQDSGSSFILHPSALAGFPLAFALLCIGFLVHFSVGPYGLFLGLHYLAAVWWKRPRKFVEAGLIAAVSLAVFAAWFPWSIVHYGAKTTFTSTSAVSDSAKMSATDNVANIAKNTVNTIVPTIVQKPWLVWADDASRRDIDLDQPSTAGQLRDFMFLIYQVSVPGGLGLVGCGMVVYLLVRVATGRDTTAKPVRRFWLAFIPIVYFAGVSVYGGVDRFGVAHICLQPMIFCGLAFLAGGVWRISLRLRALLIIGLLADFGLGVMLQMSLQHEVPPIETYVVQAPDGTPRVVFDIKMLPDTPSRAAQNNAGDRLKLSVDTPRDFWGDRFRDGGLLPLQLSAGAMMAFFLFMGFAGRPDPGARVEQRGFPVASDRRPPAKKRKPRR